MKAVFIRHLRSSLEKNVSGESMSLIFAFVVGNEVVALRFVEKEWKGDIIKERFIRGNRRIPSNGLLLA